MKKYNKKYYVIISIGIVILGIIYLINSILAKYKSSGSSEIPVSIAIYVLDSGIQDYSFKLDGVAPNNGKKTYDLIVSNTKDGKTSETAMEYSIQIKTTTNLPLNYNLYLKDDYNKKGMDEFANQIKSRETIVEDDVPYLIMKTDIKQIELVEHTDTYILEIEFQEGYETQLDYADIIELLEITVNSNQKI